MKKKKMSWSQFGIRQVSSKCCGAEVWPVDVSDSGEHLKYQCMECYKDCRVIKRLGKIKWGWKEGFDPCRKGSSSMLIWQDVKKLFDAVNSIVEYLNEMEEK